MKINKYHIILFAIHTCLIYSQNTESLLIKREIETLRQQAGLLQYKDNLLESDSLYGEALYDFSDSLKVYDFESELEEEGILKFFGYDFFQTFPERIYWDNQPPPGDYIIGSGDEVIIEIWGDTQLKEVHTVDQYGTVYIDKIGQIHLNNKTLEEVETVLLHKLQNVYSSLQDPAPTAYMDISLGKLKSINVTFLGEVNAPGIHAIHSFSSIITALMQTGGLDETGSLRGIQLIRNGKTVTTFDFYDYLLKGDAKKDVRLVDSDILFVPVRHSSIKVKGEVIRQGIYEILSGETIDHVIKYSGGLTSQAHLKARVSRGNNTSGKIGTQFIDLQTNRNFQMLDGDVVELYEIAGSEHVVFIYGQIKKPGEYAFDTEKDLKLLDILNFAGGLSDPTYLNTIHLETGEIIRNHYDSEYPEIIDFNINRLRDGDSAENHILQNWDIILVRQNPNFVSPAKVWIQGEVNIPGIYTISKREETISDMLSRAGGLTQKAYEEGIRMFRNGAQQVAIQNFDMVLLDGDSLSVPINSGIVEVLGAVNRPGFIQYNKRKSLKNYIEHAGGYTLEADRSNITIVFANGDVSVKKRFRQMKVTEGSTIIIHLKEPEEPVTLSEFSTNVASIITSFATLYLLFQQ